QRSLVGDVVGHEDLVVVAGLDQREHVGHAAAVVRQVEARVVGIVGGLQPEEVVLEPDPRPGQVDHRLHVGDRPADVAHDRRAEVTALLPDVFRDLHRRVRVATGVDHEGGAGLALGDHGRPHDLLLVVRPRPGAADLADEAGADAGIAHAGGDVGDDLAGQVVHRAPVHVRGVGGRHVVAGPHHDVESGGAGDAGQGQRVAGEAPRRGIDHGPAPGVLEEEDLVPGDLLVGQTEV